MRKISPAFTRFVFDGVDRCEYCNHVLYHVDDCLAVCLNCGACFTSSNFRPTSLFEDTCSADPRGKEDHEI